MKRLSVVLVVMAITGAVFAESTRDLTKNNQFGGLTREISYNKGEKMYDFSGVQKTVAYYDAALNLKRAEYTFTAESAAKNNHTAKYEVYENKRAVSGEYLYTEKYSQEKGIVKTLDTYDNRGKIVATEVTYTKKFAEQNGYEWSSVVYVSGFPRERNYRYTEDWAKKIGYTRRQDLIISDSYANEKVREKVYFDAAGNVIKKEQAE